MNLYLFSSVKRAITFLLSGLFLTFFSCRTQQKESILLASGSGHSLSITKIIQHPVSGNVISASWDGTVRVWDPANGSLLRTIYTRFFSTDGKLGIDDVCLTPKGDVLVVACKQTEKEQIVLLNFETGAEIFSHSLTYKKGGRLLSKKDKIPIKDRRDIRLAFTPDGATLVVAAGPLGLNSWSIREPYETYSDLLTEEKIKNNLFRERSVAWGTHICALRFASNGQFLISFSRSGDLINWYATDPNSSSTSFANLKAKKSDWAVSWTIPAEQKWSTLQILGDSLILIGQTNGRLYTLGTDQRRMRERTLSLLPGKIYTVSLSPDGENYFVAGTLLCESSIVESRTGKLVARLEPGHHLCPILQSTFLGKDKLVTGDVEGKMFIWDAKTGKMLYPLHGPNTRIQAVSSNPGNIIAAGTCLDKRHFDPCASKAIKTRFPVHPLEWVFDPFTLTVTQKILPFQPFKAPLFKSRNTDLFAKASQANWSLGYTFYRTPSLSHNGLILCPFTNCTKVFQSLQSPPVITYPYPSIKAQYSWNEDFVLLGGYDGVVRICNRSSAQLVLSIFVIDTSNWVCWTPDLLMYEQGNQAARQVGRLVSEPETGRYSFYSLPDLPKVKRDSSQLKTRLRNYF